MNISPALLEIKRGDVTADGVFTGYAATFGGAPDLAGDIIQKGAFINSLRQHKQLNTMPAMLWSHLPEEPVGKWLSMEEDNHGLMATGRLTMATERGKGAFALLKDEAISLSIGFNKVPGGYSISGDIRTLREINLREVSLVALPANPHAKIIERPETRRQYEHLLRQAAGLSAREAKRAAAGGWGALVRQERETDLDSIFDATQEILNTLRTR